MIPRADVLIGNLTHVGMERSENQDYYGYYEPEDDAEFDLKGRLIIVCDGMGGHAGGEVASRLAVDTIVETYKNDKSGNVLEALRLAVEAANQAIWKHAQENAQLKGMGSTCVAMAVKQGMGYFAHVGDSRCYLVRNDQIFQVTKDHSLVQQMVDEGLLREEEMESHPEKNVILRSLGVKPDVDVEVSYQPLQVGDLYCLSTDGLTGLVSKEECRRICIMQKDNPMEAARLLVDLANKYGGYDNITVQIVRVLSLEPGGAGGRATPVAEQVTGVYSEEDVQRSIAEARAKAAQVAPVKLAPSAAEMAGGKAQGRPQQEQKGITMAMTAPSKEELKKAMREAQAQQAPAPVPAPAPAAGGGTGRLVAVALVAAVLFLAAGLVAGQKMAARTTAARERLAAAMAQAKASGVESSPAFKAAEVKAMAARKKADGFLGSFTGATDLDAAAKEIEKLVGSKSSSATVDDANNARRAMLARRASAADADAQTHAQVDWSKAESLNDTGQKALEAKSYGEAVVSFERSEEAYRRAANKAFEAKARIEVEALKANLASQLSSQEAAKAREYIPELVEGVNVAKAEAERLQQGDAVRALSYIKHAELLMQAAMRIAPEIEKKN